MGIFRETKEKMITNFLSSRINLTIFQFLLYFIMGYIMGQYLTWGKMVIMFLVVFGLQFVARSKGVADGMMFRQIMFDNEMDDIMGTNEVLEKVREEAKRAKKENDIN